MRSQVYRYGLLAVCGLSLLIVVLYPLNSSNFSGALKFNFALGFFEWLNSDNWNVWDKVAIVLRNLLNWATVAGVVLSLPTWVSSAATQATSFGQQSSDPPDTPAAVPPGIDRP